MFRCDHHHQGAYCVSFNTVTLASSHSMLPDDGDHTETFWSCFNVNFNPLNAELNPIYHLLALLGAHHILHVSRVRVKTPLKNLFCISW